MRRLRFYTRDLAKRNSMSAFQDIQTLAANINPLFCLDQLSFIETAWQLLPNLKVCTACTATAAVHLSLHTYNHVPNENCKNMVLLMPLDGMMVISEESNDPVYCRVGEVLLMPVDLNYQVCVVDAVSVAIIDIPTMLITSDIFNPGGCQIEKVASVSMPELHMLISYIKTLVQVQMENVVSPNFISLASAQIYDLIVFLFGAKQEEAKVASKCYLRAGRLEAIKRDILKHIIDSELSIGQVALRQGISPQYIQTLFRSEETTFTDYVTELRLYYAYQHLCDPVYSDHRISALAFDIGFNNISWFNRAFKRRFNLTPSEVRTLSQQSTN